MDIQDAPKDPVHKLPYAMFLADPEGVVTTAVYGDYTKLGSELRTRAEAAEARIEAINIAVGIGKGGDVLEAIKGMHRRLAGLTMLD